MMEAKMNELHPIFYGSTTVGERGQVVIPAEARRDLDITPSTKLLVMGGPHKNVVILAKAEYVTEMITKMTDVLPNLKSRFNTSI
jgi:AbrB family looped-hinge helix DNA binding protein